MQTSALDDAGAKISEIQWHDSKFHEQHVIRDYENNCHHVRLDFDLIQSSNKGHSEYATRSLLFRDCKLFQSNLELFGFTFTRGHIAEATFCRSFSDLRGETREAFRRFDFSEGRNPLLDCFFFRLEMIAPGGSLALFAKALEI
jgi:hypothetical protein